MTRLPKKIEKETEIENEVSEVEPDVKELEIEALRAEIEALKAVKAPEDKKPVRNLSLDEIALRTKEELKKYPKEKIFVPLDQGNPNDDVLPISINGYTLRVRKGVYSEVPKPIADIYNASYAADIEALGKMKDSKEPIASL
jgi:hypothetical protein